ncbi:F-box domain-containing protein [Mycena chlorophos]|uniref:F-box domain-containing protein n=1 Tax=Mycena chlorophos TaxID=658473 RepID=A0A8H6TGP1_MYCCL|nr:F-box domain-containing protein [Mycena chlorophos]
MSVADARAQLGRIDAEIYRIEHESAKYIAALEAAEAVLLERLSHLTFPILTLPRSILSRIFTECLPRHGRVRMAPDAIPFKLAQVCREWREVALGTPALWASQDVVLKFFSEENAAGWTTEKSALFDLCAERAMDTQHCPRVPLSLSIRHEMPKTKTTSMLIRVPASLTSVIPHVRRLEADISASQFRELRPLQTPTPNLESLAVAVDADGLHDLVHHAPKLRDLRLRDYPSDARLVSSTLVNLEICVPQADTALVAVLEILQHCPALEVLRTPMEVSFAHELDPSSSAALERAIQHHKLKTLALTSTSRALVAPESQSIMRLFSLLDAPNLRSLDVIIPGHSDHKDVLETTETFLSHCSARIKNLRLTILPLDTAIWLSLLSPTDLETLEVVAHPSTNECAYPFADDFALAPFAALRKITFALETTRDCEVSIDWPALLAIVRARKSNGLPPLESFHLSTIWKRTFFSHSAWFPPDKIFNDAPAGESDDDVLALAEQITLVQKFAVPHDDEQGYGCGCDGRSWDDFYNEYNCEEEVHWPDRESEEGADGKKRDWLVRRWPESALGVNIDAKAKPVDDADPCAEFTLTPDAGQKFGKPENWSSDEEEYDEDEDEDSEDEAENEDGEAAGEEETIMKEDASEVSSVC